MEEYLNTPGCRMVSLHMAMDGEAPVSGIAGCCCDNCSPGNGLKLLWSNAVDLVQQSVEVDEDDFHRDGMDIDVHNERQDQVRNNRMSLAATMDDWTSIYGKTNTNCAWHQSTDLHIGIRENGFVLQCRDCKKGLMKFLGHENENDWCCYGCCDAGSASNRNCDKRGKCRYKTMEDNGITANCTKCWYMGCPRQQNRRDECPQVRLRALAIWALRSEEGYTRVQAKYPRSEPFPDRIPFHREIEALGIREQDNIQKWQLAQVWLLSGEQINLSFWKAVKEAVSEYLEEIRNH
jgi:hypothetical protein